MEGNIQCQKAMDDDTDNKSRRNTVEQKKSGVCGLGHSHRNKTKRRRFLAFTVQPSNDKVAPGKERKGLLGKPDLSGVSVIVPVIGHGKTPKQVGVVGIGGVGAKLVRQR